MKPLVMTVYGTRPEAIKVAPLVRALEASMSLASMTVVTGQHREMLDQVNELFAIVPDVDLDVFGHGQSLSGVAARILDRLDPVLLEVAPALSWSRETRRRRRLLRWLRSTGRSR